MVKAPERRKHSAVSNLILFLSSSRGKRGAAIAATKYITKGKGRASGADNEKRNVSKWLASNAGQGIQSSSRTNHLLQRSISW
jgi:hypothetical protein